MKIWLGEHEVSSGQFGLLCYGHEPARLATPGRWKALFQDAFQDHLPGLVVEAARRGPYVSIVCRSKLATVTARAQLEDTRVLLTCQAYDSEPRGLVEALEALAVRLEPREVDLLGFPDGGRSGRQPYDPEGLLFGRMTHSETSRFQRIEVGEHPVFGRVLFLNGEAQIASSDEDLYSSQLIKGALVKSTRKVLVMGGGDCGVLRQVLGHPQVESAVMVEIDEAVVKAAKRHFPQVVGEALRDSRGEVVVGDAFAYVRDHGGFDLIVYDLSDTPLNLEGYGEVFPLINGALAKRGRVAVQCGSGMKQDAPRLKPILRSLKRSFESVTTREVVIPSFVDRPWVFAYGKKK